MYSENLPGSQFRHMSDEGVRLDKCDSDFNVHTNHLGILLNCRFKLHRFGMGSARSRERLMPLSVHGRTLSSKELDDF